MFILKIKLSLLLVICLNYNIKASVSTDLPKIAFFFKGIEVYRSGNTDLQVPNSVKYDAIDVSSEYLNEIFWSNLKLSHILSLKISKCENISTIPENAFNKFSNLKNFTITETHLQELTKKNFQILTLENLNLEVNKISKIPVGTFDGQNELKNINLKRNQLKEIKNGVFKNLEKLEIISLCGNQISVIENEAFKSLPALKTLDLSNNKLVEWKDEVFQNVPILKILDLHDNEISSISSKSFKSLVSLEKLYLGVNKIKQLNKDTFTGLYCVKELSLFLNEISLIEPGFLENLPNIEELVLMYNKLYEIKKGTFTNSKVKSIKLDHNRISDMVGGSFVNLTELSYVSIIDNNLTTFREGILDNAPKLKEVHLEANPALWRWEQFYNFAFLFPQLINNNKVYKF